MITLHFHWLWLPGLLIFLAASAYLAFIWAIITAWRSIRR